MKKENRLEMERANKNGQRVFGTLLITTALVALGMLLFSCSKGKELEVIDYSCNCGIVVETRAVDVVHSDGLHHISIMQIKNNCTGIIKQSEAEGIIPIGEKRCNY